jgi:YVTN family beta-propeller protein
MLRSRPLLTAAMILLGGCNRHPDSGASPSTSAAPTATASQAEAAAPSPRRPPRTPQGSAIALSFDGQQIIVADEDHEAIFLLPAAFSDTSGVRIVAPPGPPAQIVALDGLVLATVRTLPTEDARAARDAIRGPMPTPASAKTYPATALKPAPAAQEDRWNGRFLVPGELEKWLNGERKAPDAAPAKPRASASAGSARPAASAAPKAAPKDHTPPAPFETSTVRKSQGGLLIGYKPDAEKGLVEAFRVKLPPDAWGLSVTPDGRRAVVTSAFASEVSVIDLESQKIVASLPVAREPRGIAITKDGKTAFVSHLVGTALTKITGLDAAPTAASLPLQPAPTHVPFGTELGASLAYSVVLAPDEKTLFLPRHALGAEGIGAWWGVPTVDAMDVATEKPVAPLRKPGMISARIAGDGMLRPPADWTASPGQAPGPRPELLQPRAAVYRKKTDTLLIASEGWDTLAEVDARTLDPATFVVRTFDLAGAYDAFGHHPVRGGAPTGVVLAEDENTAFVFCRTTFDVARIDLETGNVQWLHLADDGLPADAARGRRLFTNARSSALSGGLGCAGCHPEGRDDGYVWREGDLSMEGAGNQRFVGSRANVKLNDGWRKELPRPDLYPRQTPLIAGRLRAPGPYGWHAESKTLVDRLVAGASLHRESWRFGSGVDPSAGEDVTKIDALFDYLLSGLLPPPTLARELTAQEQKGKALFESPQTACATCHAPASGFTDRVAYPLRALPTRLTFETESNQSFKTPSLWFIAGTAPYFHDGSAATLEELVRNNKNRMGATEQLTVDEKDALIAYLRTL